MVICSYYSLANYYEFPRSEKFLCLHYYVHYFPPTGLPVERPESVMLEKSYCKRNYLPYKEKMLASNTAKTFCISLTVVQN